MRKGITSWRIQSFTYVGMSAFLISDHEEGRQCLFTLVMFTEMMSLSVTLISSILGRRHH